MVFHAYPCATVGNCTKHLCVLSQTSPHSLPPRGLFEHVVAVRSLRRFWDPEWFLLARSKKSLDRLIDLAKRVLKRGGKVSVIAAVERKSFPEQELIETHAKELQTFFKAIENIPILSCLCCSILQKKQKVRCADKIKLDGNKLFDEVLDHRHGDETTKKLYLRPVRFEPERWSSPAASLPERSLCRSNSTRNCVFEHI